MVVAVDVDEVDEDDVVDEVADDEVLLLIQKTGWGQRSFRMLVNPNHPGPCVCKYDTNIDAHL